MLRFLRKKSRITEVQMTSNKICNVEIKRKYSGVVITRFYKVTDLGRWHRIWRLCSKKFPDKSFSGKYFYPPLTKDRDWYVHFWTNSATVFGVIFTVIWWVVLMIYFVREVAWEIIWKLF